MTIMTVIYILVGIIALCGVISAYKFFSEQLADDYYDNYFERNQEGLSDKDIEFINNYEYCSKENNDA